MNAKPSQARIPAVLCVDDSMPDQKAVKLALNGLIRSHSIQLLFASSIEEALRILSDRWVHVVLLDIDLGPEEPSVRKGTRVRELAPAHNGIYAIQEIRNLQSHLEIIMVTGHSQPEVTPASKRLGALSVVEKRHLDQLASNVTWAVKLADERLSKLAHAFGGEESIPYVVGISSQARLERSRIAAAVKSPHENILILGEPGSGKTSRAKWIHTLRSIQLGKMNRPFVNVNVSAWSESMMDRELFGHKKGSFTGALSDMKGAIERADGGTLFLDEIGELPSELQCKLLKFLQERVYTPLGGSQQEARCEIIAATNRDLTRAVADGEFRQDLYERFPIVIRIAPLYERKEDLRYILRSVLRGLKIRYPESQLTVESIPSDLIKTLEDSEIPGGYRVLENILAALILFAPDDPFTEERDYRNWNAIPEIHELIYRPKPFKISRQTVSLKDPITLRELLGRGFDFVGHPEFTTLAATLEQIKQKIYEDAWAKHGKNEAVAAVLDVAASTACHYTVKLKRRETGTRGLRTQLQTAQSEQGVS